MSIATITLSRKGQVVIPKEIRNQLQWVSGTKITMFSSAYGITLKAVPTKKGRKLEDLIGMLKHDGPPLSTNALCAPVEYAQDWNASEILVGWVNAKFRRFRHPDPVQAMTSLPAIMDGTS